MVTAERFIYLFNDLWTTSAVWNISASTRKTSLLPNAPDNRKRIERVTLEHIGLIPIRERTMTEEQDKIVRFDEHSHSFNLPDTDFKAGVVASGLKEDGYDAERTLISQTGRHPVRILEKTSMTSTGIFPFMT